MTTATLLQFWKVHTPAQDPGDAGLCECTTAEEAAVWYARMLAQEARDRAEENRGWPPKPRGSTRKVLVRRPVAWRCATG